MSLSHCTIEAAGALASQPLESMSHIALDLGPNVRARCPGLAGLAMPKVAKSSESLCIDPFTHPSLAIHNGTFPQFVSTVSRARASQA